MITLAARGVCSDPSDKLFVGRGVVCGQMHSILPHVGCFDAGWNRILGSWDTRNDDLADVLNFLHTDLSLKPCEGFTQSVEFMVVIDSADESDHGKKDQQDAQEGAFARQGDLSSEL